MAGVNCALGVISKYGISVDTMLSQKNIVNFYGCPNGMFQRFLVSQSLLTRKYQKIYYF